MYWTLIKFSLQWVTYSENIIKSRTSFLGAIEVVGVIKIHTNRYMDIHKHPKKVANKFTGIYIYMYTHTHTHTHTHTYRTISIKHLCVHIHTSENQGEVKVISLNGSRTPEEVLLLLCWNVECVEQLRRVELSLGINCWESKDVYITLRLIISAGCTGDERGFFTLCESTVILVSLKMDVVF
jgi:hypothetical protein